MAIQAAVTLNSVVYDPDGKDGIFVRWANRVGGVLNSFSTLTQSFLTAQGAKKLTKISFRVDVPIVATSDSTCACTGSQVRTSSAIVSVWLDPGATAAERADITARVKDLTASTLFSSAVSDLSPAYA